MEYHPPVSTLEATRRVRVDGQAISPHGSIMFRRDAYEKAGGYREEYYYAQDIDLTTRLAEIGPVAAVPEILFEYQLAPDAISGRHGRYQRAFYRLIRRGHEFRMKGKSEDALLDAARRLSQKCLRRRNRGASAYELYYFIGTRLLAVQPVRAGMASIQRSVSAAATRGAPDSRRGCRRVPGRRRVSVRAGRMWVWTRRRSSAR